MLLVIFMINNIIKIVKLCMMGVVPTVSGARPSHRPLHNGGRSTIVTLQHVHCWTTSQDYSVDQPLLHCCKTALQDFIVDQGLLHCKTILQYYSALQCIEQDFIEDKLLLHCKTILQDYIATLHCNTIFEYYNEGLNCKT